MNAYPSPAFFIIAGPTAVGKSELAVLIAEHCNGEIVSADAFQVYQGLDILTAKPGNDLLQRVPHHLISEVPLTHSFDVGQYLRLAQERMLDIRQRGKLPIIAGGTGLYLRALTHGLADLPTADAALRAELETQTTEALLARLAALDPVCYSQIDLQNRRRVVRALEVCLLSGRPFSSFREQWRPLEPGSCGIYLDRERPELHDRIHRRTDAMFAAGVVEEVTQTVGVGPTACQTLGWKEIRALIAGTLTRENCIQAIEQATRQYAKRQLTWFRREGHLERIEISGESLSSALVETLSQRALRTIGQ